MVDSGVGWNVVLFLCLCGAALYPRLFFFSFFLLRGILFVRRPILVFSSQDTRSGGSFFLSKIFGTGVSSAREDEASRMIVFQSPFEVCFLFC